MIKSPSVPAQRYHRTPRFALSRKPHFALPRKRHFALSRNPHFALSRKPHFSLSQKSHFALSRKPHITVSEASFCPVRIRIVSGWIFQMFCREFKLVPLGSFLDSANMSIWRCQYCVSNSSLETIWRKRTLSRTYSLPAKTFHHKSTTLAARIVSQMFALEEQAP